MDGYTLLGLKLAMGIIGLVLQINLMGKGNLLKTIIDLLNLSSMVSLSG
ncbi:hypothetical protein [Aggregatibacter aphrophilus]|jgi:hypothetical protein|nr:hypothetical protein [Aggregatibacter aphrophilus]EHB90984.1 hypothetical protein HMPREF9335_00674 [Aggregatibacter aphrophilus F0387]